MCPSVRHGLPRTGWLRQSVDKLYVWKPPGKLVVTYTGKKSNFHVAETIKESEEKSPESEVAKIGSIKSEVNVQ